MKKSCLVFLFFISFVSFSQVKFEKGNIIINSDTKIECLIKNMGWKNNPISFEYKTNDSNESKIGHISDIKSFEIYNQLKYVRQVVKIDKSSKNLNNLSRVRSPEFIEKQVFLKQIIIGDANLYRYDDGDYPKFFMQIKNNTTEQLIYKPYVVEADKIAYNENYKLQLKTYLICPNFNISEKKAEYKEKYLIATFNEFNQCKDSSYQVIKKIKRGIFNLSVRPRLNFSSLNLSNDGTNTKVEPEGKTGFGFGIEAEYILPYNKNKWAVLIEPTYQYYKLENTKDINFLIGGKQNTTVDYKSLELPFGIRHYMYINDTSKLFLNFLCVIDIPMNSSIEFKRNDGAIYNSLDIGSKPNYAFGLGYNYANKYGIELRYFTNRNIISDYTFWQSDYKNFSIILSYNLL